jgi:hypothetical protein
VPHFLNLDNFHFATNPRDQHRGKRSLFSSSKLGQGGEIFHPHHSIQFISISTIIYEEGCIVGGFSTRRAHCLS